MDFLFCIFYVRVGKQVGNLSVASLSHIFQSLPSVVIVVVVVGQRTKTMSRKTLKCITKLKWQCKKAKWPLEDGSKSKRVPEDYTTK